MLSDTERMRQALLRIATDPQCCKFLPMEDRESAWNLAKRGSDETLKILFEAVNSKPLA